MASEPPVPAQKLKRLSQFYIENTKGSTSADINLDLFDDGDPFGSRDLLRRLDGVLAELKIAFTSWASRNASKPGSSLANASFSALCQNAFVLFDEAEPSLSEPSLQLVRQAFGSEDCLANGLCDVLEHEVQWILRANEAALASGGLCPPTLASVANLLRSLVRLSEQGSGAAQRQCNRDKAGCHASAKDKMMELLPRRLVSCLVDVGEQAKHIAEGRWLEVQRYTKPVYELLTSRELVSAAPGTIAALIQSRTEDICIVDRDEHACSVATNYQQKRCNVSAEWLYHAGCLAEELLERAKGSIPNTVLLDVRRSQSAALLAIAKQFEGREPAPMRLAAKKASEDKHERNSAVDVPKNSKALLAKPAAAAEAVAMVALAATRVNKGAPSKRFVEGPGGANPHHIQKQQVEEKSPVAAARDQVGKSMHVLADCLVDTSSNSPTSLMSGRGVEVKVEESRAQPYKEHDTNLPMAPLSDSPCNLKESAAAQGVDLESMVDGEHRSQLRFFLDVFVRLQFDLLGGAKPFAARAGLVLQAEVERLIFASKPSEDCNGKSDETEAIVTSRGKINALVWLLRESLMTQKAEEMVEELVPLLLSSAMRVIDLPQELRHSLQPIQRMLLQESLLQHTGSELWCVIEASLQAKKQPRPQWVYAAGCFALEIEHALLAMKVSCAPRLVEMMRQVQFSARTHLAWIAYCETPVSEIMPSAKRHSAKYNIDKGEPVSEIMPNAKPHSAKCNIEESRRRNGQISQAADDTRDVAGDVAAACPSSDDDRSDETWMDEESEADVSMDHYSDLDGFIDVTSEYNQFGLLESALDTDVVATEGDIAAVDSSGPPESQTLPKTSLVSNLAHCAVKPVANWQGVCRNMLEHHPEPVGLFVEEPDESEDATSNPFKRLRRST